MGIEVFLKKPKAPLNDTLAREIIESGKGPLAKTPKARVGITNGNPIQDAFRRVDLCFCCRPS